MSAILDYTAVAVAWFFPEDAEFASVRYEVKGLTTGGTEDTGNTKKIPPVSPVVKIFSDVRQNVCDCRRGAGATVWFL